MIDYATFVLTMQLKMRHTLCRSLLYTTPLEIKTPITIWECSIMEHQVDISLYVTEATALRHYRKLAGLKPSWCTSIPLAFWFPGLYNWFHFIEALCTMFGELEKNVSHSRAGGRGNQEIASPFFPNSICACTIDNHVTHTIPMYIPRFPLLKANMPPSHGPNQCKEIHTS